MHRPFTGNNDLRVLRRVICVAAILFPVSYATFGQTAPAPTPSPAASTPSGQSADPRRDEQSRKGATEAGPGTSQTSDQHFMKEAAQGGMAEVELGQLAAERASSAEVKEFAQRMVKDHSQANDQLKQIASQKGVTLPNSLSAKDASRIRSWATRSAGIATALPPIKAANLRCATCHS